MVGEKLLGVAHRGSRIAAIIAGGLILLSAFAITIDVLGRFFLDRILVESFELSRYIFAIGVAFSLSFAAIEKAHIRIDVVVKLLGVKWRALIGVLAVGTLAMVACYFAARGCEVALQSWRINARPVSGFRVPLWIPQALWALGLVWFAVTTVILTIISLIGAIQRRWTEVEAMVGTPSVDEEIEQATTTNEFSPEPGEPSQVGVTR